MSKLILINGPLGSGKSTLAKAYAERHDMTLALDIDQLWFMLGRWRENKEVSSPHARKLGFEMLKHHLGAGYDAVVPQIVQQEQFLASFEETAKATGSMFVHVLLELSFEESLERYVSRGKANGYVDGFNPEGIIANTGRDAKLAEMHRNMTELVASRDDVFKVYPEQDKPDETIKLIESAISQAST